jgi:hypothetical protein
MIANTYEGHRRASRGAYPPGKEGHKKAQTPRLSSLEGEIKLIENTIIHESQKAQTRLAWSDYVAKANQSSNLTYVLWGYRVVGIVLLD